jgi:hypothetical protein
MGLKEAGNVVNTKSLRLDSPILDGTQAHNMHTCVLFLDIYLFNYCMLHHIVFTDCPLK